MKYLRKFQHGLRSQSKEFIPFKRERDGLGKILSETTKCNTIMHSRRKYVSIAYKFRPSVSDKCSESISHSLVREYRSTPTECRTEQANYHMRTHSIALHFPEIKKAEPSMNKSLAYEVLLNEKRVYKHWANTRF